MADTKFFKHFPTIEYTIGNVTKNVKDLTRTVVISRDFLDRKFPFYDYVIRDGERPDHVSYQQYGSSKYYWIILVINDIRDVWTEWPMSTRELNKYISAKYGSLEEAQAIVHEYQDAETGEIIDEQEAIELGSGSITISKYDYEFRENENKRNIRLVQRRYLSRIREELEERFE